MKRNSILTIFLALLVAVGVCGCSQAKQVEEKKPDFSQVRQVAELSTIECTYHNVAEFYDDGTQILPGLTVGYKKAWFEYDGTLWLGVDASKVSVSDPDEEGVVTVTLPEAEVQKYDVDKSSFSDVYTNTGLATKLTTEDQTVALEEAQKQMVESAQENDTLLKQARSRAGNLLESYVKEAGKVIKQTYTVKFVDEEGNALKIIAGEVEKLSDGGSTSNEEQETTSSKAENADTQ